MKLSRALIGILVVVLVAVCAVAGLLLLPRPLPESLASAEPLGSMEVVAQDYSDEMAVGVAVQYGPDRTLVSGVAGVITKSDCVAGDELTSGDVPLWVDGQPLLTLATKIPLWRDLTLGTKGSDVSALRSELSRLKMGVNEGSSFDQATLTAFRKLISKSGGDAGSITSISVAQLLWLPAPAIAPLACSVTVGSRVEQGGLLATLPATVDAAAISPMPTDIADGKRTLTVDDEAFEVDGNGSIAAADLDRLAGAPSFEVARGVGPDEPVKGTLRLTDPVQVYPIPPRAIITSGDVACVDDSGAMVLVEIVGSELGKSYVRPVADGQVLTQVNLSPAGDATCS